MIIKNKPSGRHIHTVTSRYLNKVAVIAALLFTVLFNPGCKKDEGGIGPKGDYYIVFKANGKDHLINYATTQTAGIVDSTNLRYEGKKVYVYTLGAANSNAEALSIGFYSATALVAPRTFKEDGTIYNTYTEALLHYDPNAQAILSGKSYMSIGTVAFPTPGLPTEFPTIPRDFTVTISEYNDVYISGTFSGTVYQADIEGTDLVKVNEKISITEGEFKLKLP